MGAFQFVGIANHRKHNGGSQLQLTPLFQKLLDGIGPRCAIMW